MDPDRSGVLAGVRWLILATRASQVIAPLLCAFSLQVSAAQSWSAQTDLGGVELSSAPSAVSNGRHVVDVFYQGPNKHLWTSWWPDKPGSQWWSPPTDLGGVELTSPPAAMVGVGPQKVQVFYRGPNLHLWTSWWPDKPGSLWWSAPTDLGGVERACGPRRSGVDIGSCGAGWRMASHGRVLSGS